MGAKWIAVVSAADARLFRARGLELFETLHNELGREKNRALTQDRPGFARNKYIGASGIHALTGERDQHEQASAAFAKRVVEYLKQNLDQHRFESLEILAEPKMTGRLRSRMPKELLERTQWRSADLGKLQDSQLRRRLERSAKSTDLIRGD